MAYPGRILMPHPGALMADGEPLPWLFRECGLVRSRRNSIEAKQLASKHMIIPEEVGDTVLPNTSAAAVQGALKYTQVGGDAADKLLRSATAPSPNIAAPFC